MSVQRSILTQQSPPTTNDSKDNETIKVEIDWSNNDDKLANYNKVLNVIFNGVDAKQIKLMSSCEPVKEAYDLKTTFEGLGDVNYNKLNAYQQI